MDRHLVNNMSSGKTRSQMRTA